MSLSSVGSAAPDTSARASVSAAASIWRLVSAKSKSIVCFNRGDADAVPFYCIHGISGDVLALNVLRPRLGDRQPFYGIQVTGRQMSPDLGQSIEHIAAHHVRALQEFQPEGPLALGGWSAGAVILVEVAQQLKDLGRDVVLLVAFDGAPCNAAKTLDPYSPSYIYRLILNFPLWLKYEALGPGWTWRGLLDRVVRKISFSLRNFNAAFTDRQTVDQAGVDRVLDRDSWQSNQRLFMYNLYDAMMRYVPKPYDGRVVVYEVKTQPIFYLRQVADAWRALSDRVEVVPFDGSHADVLREPAIDVIGEHLRQRLSELSRQPRSA